MEYFWHMFLLFFLFLDFDETWICPFASTLRRSMLSREEDPAPLVIVGSDSSVKLLDASFPRSLLLFWLRLSRPDWFDCPES